MAAEREERLPGGFAILIAAVALIGAGYAIWEKIPVALHPPALYASLACYLLGFAACALAFVPLAPRTRDALALTGFCAAFLLPAACWVAYVITYYGTDSLLFNAYAARLLLAGIDPYTQSMRPAYDLYGVPPSLVTPTLTGEAIYALSYPALSFLVYVPFEALHLGNVLWLSIAAQLAIVLALFALAPRPYKALAVVPLFADGAYFQYAVGAVTDVLWVLPFVFVAAWWDRRPVWAAVLLGLACSIKQTPWIVVPFALVAWLLAARRLRDWRAFVYPLAALAGTFALFNLPFALWHPVAWLHGSFTPLAGNLVPFGSGIVQLATSALYDIPIGNFGIIAAVVFVVALLAYAWRPRALGFLPFLAPALVLFCTSRSLHNYFMYWPIVLTAYLATAGAFVPVSVVAPRLDRRALALAAAAVVVIIGGLALAAFHPRSATVAIADARFDRVDGRLRAIGLDVRNNTGAPQELRFGLMRSGIATSLTMLDGGLPTAIAPNTKTHVVLAADAHGGAAGTGGPQTLQVVAIDPHGGQVWSPSKTIVPPESFLTNPQLRRWTAGKSATPVGWDVDLADFRAGRIVRDGDTLRFAVTAPPEAAWTVASVGQIAPAQPVRFTIRVKPEVDYVGDQYPLAFFGLELIDALDRHVDIAFDSRLTAPKTYRRDRFVTLVYPVKLHVWNDVPIDLAGLSGQFFFGQAAKMKVEVVAAVHKGSIPALHGSFGGIYNVQLPSTLAQ